MAKKRKARQEIVYTDQDRERKLMELKLGTVWSEALHDAYQRKITKLREYLLSNLPLDDLKREDLANLIERRIERYGGKGRKPGTIPPRDPDEINEAQFVRLLRGDLEHVRKQSGGRVPRGGYKRAFERLCQWLGAQGYTFNFSKTAKDSSVLTEKGQVFTKDGQVFTLAEFMLREIKRRPTKEAVLKEKARR